MKEKTAQLNKENMKTIERIQGNSSLSDNLKRKMISDIINHSFKVINFLTVY